mgnify:CR=1 FL=1
MKSKEEALAKIKELEKALDLKRQEAADASKAMTKTIEDYEARLKALSESNRQLVKGEHLIQTLRELLVPPGAGVPNSGTGQSISASIDKPEIELTLNRPTLPADETTTIGKVALLVHDGFFDERHTASQVTEEFHNRGWMNEKRDVELGLLGLCKTAHLYRKKSTGKMFWFQLTEDGKERVKVKKI